MERIKIIKAVQTRLNELTSKNSIDIIPNALIESLLDSVALNFLMSAPVFILPKVHATPSVVGKSDGTGYFLVPSDYLRLVSFRLDDWIYSVNDLLIDGTIQAKMQHFKYTRGTVNRPVGVLSFDGDGAKRIEYYTALNANPTVDEFVYIKFVKPELLPDNLIELFCWMVVSEVLQVQEYVELSKAAYDRFVTLVNQYNNAT